MNQVLSSTKFLGQRRASPTEGSSGIPSILVLAMLVAIPLHIVIAPCHVLWVLLEDKPSKEAYLFFLARQGPRHCGCCPMVSVAGVPCCCLVSFGSFVSSLERLSNFSTIFGIEKFLNFERANSKTRSLCAGSASFLRTDASSMASLH